MWSKNLPFFHMTMFYTNVDKLITGA